MADKRPESQPLPLRFIGALLRLIIKVFGIASLVLTLLAFTQLPWKGFAALGDGGPPLKGDPDFIVIMGGGGIPSESGLFRTYAGAEAARRFPKARVVIAVPGETAGTNSTPAKMRDELMMRGVARQRMLFEDKGRNTHEQALNCFKLLAAAGRQPALLIVTSSEHMRRSMLSFRKAGFTGVAGSATEAAAVEADLRIQTSELKDRHIPDVGQSILLRYTFWNNVIFEAKIAHELTALAYYKLLGWI
jgi:uncharacterized SAM-binding protein YcdF (DUF218 family)